jgi:hypothetical protein
MTSFLDRYGEQLGDAASALFPAPDHEPERAGRGRSRTRSRLRSPVAIALSVVLLCAAAALAADSLLPSGAPVTLRPGAPLLPHSGLGVPVAGSSPLVTVRTSDPAGGPAWGGRVVVTTRGYACLQIGRVVREQLGVIGQDGAFANDGRFHLLPTDYLEGPFPCGPLDGGGHAFSGVLIKGIPASAMTVEPGCVTAERPNDGAQRPGLPHCPAADERLLMAGLAGPQALSVTYTDEHGTPRTVPTVGPQGAYLIALADPKPGTEAGEFSPLPGPGGGTITAVAYRDGHVCRLPARADSYATCPPVGRAPLTPPGLRSASVSAPISVRLGRERAPSGSRTASIEVLKISFRARVAVSGGSSEYVVAVKFPGSGGNCGIETVDPTQSDIRAGEIVQVSVGDNSCRGRFHVRVSYAQGLASTGPDVRGGRDLTVGTRVFDVR